MSLIIVHRQNEMENRGRIYWTQIHDLLVLTHGLLFFFLNKHIFLKKTVVVVVLCNTCVFFLECDHPGLYKNVIVSLAVVALLLLIALACVWCLRRRRGT